MNPNMADFGGIPRLRTGRLAALTTALPQCRLRTSP